MTESMDARLQRRIQRYGWERASAVKPAGRVHGVDLADAMVQAARQRARDLDLGRASFVRMDAEQLALPDASFDVALCALGLMDVPDPEAALRELHRALRPGGRAVLAVWGERARYGWAPLFFGLGQGEVLALFNMIGSMLSSFLSPRSTSWPVCGWRWTGPWVRRGARPLPRSMSNSTSSQAWAGGYVGSSGQSSNLPRVLRGK